MRASQALGILLDAKARKVFEVPYLQVPSDSQQDIGKALTKLRQFTTTAQSTFALTRDKSVAMAKAALSRIANNLITIAEFTAEKASQYEIV
jgi:hypothetical protein